MVVTYTHKPLSLTSQLPPLTANRSRLVLHLTSRLMVRPRTPNAQVTLTATPHLSKPSVPLPLTITITPRPSPQCHPSPPIPHRSRPYALRPHSHYDSSFTHTHAYPHAHPHLLLMGVDKVILAAFERENYDAVAHIVPHIVLDEEATLVRPRDNRPVQVYLFC